MVEKEVFPVGLNSHSDGPLPQRYLSRCQYSAPRSKSKVDTSPTVWAIGYTPGIWVGIELTCLKNTDSWKMSKGRLKTKANSISQHY